MSDSPHFTVVGGTAAAGNALADKTIPQDTLLPLLDAPLDELATYLASAARLNARSRPISRKCTRC